jgi:hypothetical protein
MRIAEAKIDFASSYTALETYREDTSLRVWRGARQPVSEDGIVRRPRGPSARDSVSLSRRALARQFEAKAPVVERDQAECMLSEDPKLNVIRLILEALTGREIKVTRPPAAQAEQAESVPAPDGRPSSDSSPGWGMEYRVRSAHAEQESMSFSATGLIRTADGREIAFQLDLSMARAFVETSDFQIRAGDAALTDPLVINFGGPAAALDETPFLFDINADGTEEEIAFVRPGSGFLALDRNEDGEINDGSELFGPRTNDGFAELAAFDSDHNGWLDEGDSVFDSLRIWTRDSAGNLALLRLADVNIGAIFLGSADTPFSLNGHDNAVLGRLRETSVFLREDGTVGTVQEVDLTT